MHCQISYEPALVAGLQAPEIRGEYTPSAVLSLLLKGTKLRAVNVTEDMIQVVESPATTTQEVAPGSESELAYDEKSMRVAYAVEATSTATDATQEETKQNSNSTEVPADKKTTAKKQESDSLDEVVVTGTHIHGTPPASAVITLDREDIDRSGYTAVGDLLRSLPQNFGGGNNPQVQVRNAPGNSNLSPSGGTAPNLRGIGPASTLTLVNGHRLAQDTPAGGIDISLIPLDAVERVEIVTDGASAIYGSDAVAGVVNVILRKDYKGAQTSVSFGKATDGGANDWRASQLFGTTWASGGGMLVYERDKQDAVYSSQRDFTATAPTPYSLLPSTSRDSFVLTANQDISSAVSAQFDGLYTWRSGESVLTYPPTYSDPYSVNQYVSSGSLKARLGRDWIGTIFASASEQRTAYLTLSSIPNQYPEEDFEGRSRTAELDADGTLLELPSGKVRLALGAGYREESYRDATVGNGAPTSDGGRNVSYGFGELAIPIFAPGSRVGLERLDVSLSGRYEHYSDFGNTSVPKIGIVYSPAESISLRSSWGRSFRAPSLADLYGLRIAGVFRLPNPDVPTGSSYVLAPEGGNQLLQPETAKSWTAGIDYNPEQVAGLRLTATYYDIAYSNRIETIADLFTALTDPTNAAFVSYSPSLAAQQAVIANANGGLMNFSGAPYVPSSIAAIVNAGPVNVSQQDADGVDLGFDYKRSVAIGAMDWYLNATYGELRQRFTPTSPEQELAALAFNPPRYRARGGATWSTVTWSATGTVNYLGSERNTYLPTLPRVASWTTVDLKLSYKPSFGGAVSGLSVSLAVQNLFDKDPPYLMFDTYRTGLNYDSLNVSPLGRFIGLQLVKSW